MPEIEVTREQFKPDGALAVLHAPTGQHFATYRYDRVEDMSEVQGNGLTVDHDAEGNYYDPVAISLLAFELLREQLAKVVGATP